MRGRILVLKVCVCVCVCAMQGGSGGREVLVSGSDDFTLFLWHPADSKKHIARMTGMRGL